MTRIRKDGHEHRVGPTQVKPSNKLIAQIKSISHLSGDLIRAANGRVSHKKINAKKGRPEEVKKVSRVLKHVNMP